MAYDCRPENTDKQQRWPSGLEVHFLYTETTPGNEIFFKFHIVMQMARMYIFCIHCYKFFGDLPNISYDDLGH